MHVNYCVGSTQRRGVVKADCTRACPGSRLYPALAVTVMENLGLCLLRADFTDWLSETHSCQFWILLKSDGYTVRLVKVFCISGRTKKNSCSKIIEITAV
jgi:hypothetical protein